MEAVESYFLQHGTKSGHGKTSGRTLSNLCTGGNRQLPDPLVFEQFVEKWKPKHSATTNHLLAEIQKKLFPLWPFYLQEGFNILLHGVGSKRQVLDAFKEQVLSNCNSIVIPGYDNTVNIRQVI
ncbi:unnamed protein product [Echinostoma caproni]|uniref:Origin recognition complex subunit 2 n=1 Tax=Echinostoma caproni TaxID=27848 RepID=A0A183B9S6_9TREM|nr:unnamed protein product [Echinostoma caproni]